MDKRKRQKSQECVFQSAGNNFGHSRSSTRNWSRQASKLRSPSRCGDWCHGSCWTVELPITIVFRELGRANLPWANLPVNFDGVQITRWIRVNLDVCEPNARTNLSQVLHWSSTACFDCSWRVCWYELTIRDGWSWVFGSTSTRPYRRWWYHFWDIGIRSPLLLDILADKPQASQQKRNVLRYPQPPQEAAVIRKESEWSEW
jgi:hypothetical protein